MPDDADPIATRLEAVRERERSATPGPWEDADNEDHWQLFGNANGTTHPLQLIKAPKCRTPYAEYWPREADAAFIVGARTDVPLLLAVVDALLKPHRPVLNVMYEGDRCMECRDRWGDPVPFDGCRARAAVLGVLTAKGGTDA